MNKAQPAEPRTPAAHAPPCLLIIAGNDPSGGAGIAADLQTASAHGVHPMPVVTSITAQDTRDVSSVYPVPEAQVAEQLRVLLADIAPAAVKIGLLPTAAVARVVAEALRELGEQRVPVVLDPVLKAGGGGRLAEDPLAEVLREELLPLSTVTTPNRFELQRLQPELANAPPAEQAAALAKASACAVLATGADVAADLEQEQVENHAALANGSRFAWRWPRLHGRFHGSGCTLAAALACELALGKDLRGAMDAAQRYTARTLGAPLQPGRGQFIPGRMIK